MVIAWRPSILRTPIGRMYAASCYNLNSSLADHERDETTDIGARKSLRICTCDVTKHACMKPGLTVKLGGCVAILGRKL
jgi:hypothetical protein